MRTNIVIKLFSFFLVMSVFTSCLEGDLMNTPPGASPPIIEMTNNSNGGTLVNSGLRYFGNATLLLSPTDEVDTITFALTIQGISNKDVTVTLETPADAADDNYSNDSLVYKFMADNQYDFINTTAVIPAGKTYAEFK